MPAFLVVNLYSWCATVYPCPPPCPYPCGDVRWARMPSASPSIPWTMFASRLPWHLSTTPSSCSVRAHQRRLPPRKAHCQGHAGSLGGPVIAIVLVWRRVHSRGLHRRHGGPHVPAVRHHHRGVRGHFSRAALTFTPAPAAQVGHGEPNVFFLKLTDGLKGSPENVSIVKRAPAQPACRGGRSCLCSLASAACSKRVPGGLVPDEDQGYLIALMTDAAISRTLRRGGKARQGHHGRSLPAGRGRGRASPARTP